ncbi:MAG: DUF2835 domain-containing protein [Chromatiales bacterium]|nr:DUF2835 domain-containing protein [Chromatiales bacterium]
MNQIRFYLNLSAERYLSYYQGVARSISVVSVDGRRVEFPAEHLRRFVSHDGVRGEFVLKFDGDNRFTALERLGDLPPKG